MKAFLKFVGFLIIVAIIVSVIYAAYSLTKKQNTIPADTFPDQTASSTDDMAASSTPAWAFATSSTDTSSWQTYSDQALGFSIKYPASMLLNSDASSETFAFPKQAFNWPLQDDAKITVISTSTSLGAGTSPCPAFSVDGGGPSSATSTFMLNGYAFTRTENHDVAAGNLYNEIAYDTTVKGMCYRLDFFDHGANGAGLYVSDPSLISQYDAQHDADLAAVTDIFNAMAQTFTVSH